MIRLEKLVPTLATISIIVAIVLKEVQMISCKFSDLIIIAALLVSGLQLIHKNNKLKKRIRELNG